MKYANEGKCMYKCILQGFSREGMLEVVCGGREEIGSDSSAERCNVLRWVTNLRGLGQLVFSIQYPDGGRGSFVGLTIQAAAGTATRGYPNTSISPQEEGSHKNSEVD